jgi:saccharopine dehydrogenase (NAD+, L-lysine-forming)
MKLDFTNQRLAVRALKGSNCVLNCSWYEYNLKAMELALRLKAHYVDLGGLYHTTLKQLRGTDDFRRVKLIGVLGCGSTPGITNMMASRLAESFETIDTVGIYDGSYDPALSSEAFLPPFSIRTMLAEYELAAPVWKDGHIREVPAHSDPEELEFKLPIGRVRAGSVIHSETATLPGYLKAKKIRNLFFKIAYPESVKRQLELLVGMGLSQDEPIRVNGTSVSPRHFVTALAQRSALGASKGAAEKPADFEILRVRITGARHGRPLVKTWDCEIRPTTILSAGALGVGFAGAIAASMLLQGKVKITAGVGAPEKILVEEEFFRQLKARKAFSLVETIEHPLTL